MRPHRGSCLCGRNAGTAICRHCYRFTCTHCHHAPRHLDTCPETVRLERPKR